MNFAARRLWMTGAFAGLLLAGCAPKENADNTASPAPSTDSKPAIAAKTGSGDKIAVAFVTNNASDYWTIARKGVEKAQAEMPNVQVDFVIPDDGTAATQKQKVDDELAKGVKGFAISPVDPTNQTDMLNAVAKKALVFTQDSDAPKSNRACYIGTDNHAAGVMAGEQIKKALPNGGKIMLFVGKKDAQNAKDREMGIRAAVKGTKIEILDVRTDDTDRAKAKANVADTLVKYPDIAGLVGLWSYNGPAIVNAVQDSGKTGKVKIICFDEEAETLAGIKSGAIDATIVQQPFVFGYESVTRLAKAIGGDKSVIPATKLMIVPTKAIDKTSIDEYAAYMKKLRGK